MREKRFYLVFDEYEHGIIINSLNELRNKLIADGRYTDAVDELIIKLQMPRERNSKSYRGGQYSGKINL